MDEKKHFEILKNTKYESLILCWRNNVETRKNSINQDIVSTENHKRWLSSQLNKKDTKLIMNFYNSEPAGLIKLDLLKKNQYGISINLNPDYRGMNLSTGFIRDSIHYLLENQEDKNIEILASIKPHNVPSIKSFTRAGFKLTKKSYQQGLQLYSLNMINSKNILILGYKNSENPLIKFLTSKNFNVTNTADRLDFEEFQKHDLVISYGYRYILNEIQLSNCLQEPLNLHISLLPWNRGAHPNFWAFHDNTPHGVTIHKIDKGIDTGKYLLQREVAFDDGISLKDSYYELRKNIENLFIENYKTLIYKTINSFSSDLDGSFHLSKELPKNVDWNKSLRDNEI